MIQVMTVHQQRRAPHCVRYERSAHTNSCIEDRCNRRLYRCLNHTSLSFPCSLMTAVRGAAQERRA